jgi:hypothetical protein
MSTTSMNTRVRLGAVAAATVGLLAAGCSGGGTDEVNGGVPLPATTASATPTTPAAPASAPVATAAPAAAGAALNPPNCATRNLTITLTDRDAGAGSVYSTISFTNVGPETCQLRGFPGVSYVTGDDGQQVGAAAEMTGPRGDQVRLGPGGAAGAALQMPQAANFDPATCRPAPVRGLRVYPPGEKASAFVPLDTTGCAGTTPSAQLLIQTMKAR